MGFNESFEAAKNFAVNAAQTAVQKAKVLAAIAKTNVSIYAEEDKIRKAEAQLGKLYYRDYAVGEEMDSAEYLPKKAPALAVNAYDADGKLVAVYSA